MTRLPRSDLAIPFILFIVFGAAPRLPAQAPYRVATTTTAPSSSADSAVVAALGWADRLEVKLARTATPSLHDPAVKVFAGEMIDEHTADQTAIDAIARRLGLPTAAEVVLGPELAGTTDADYLGQMIARHQALLRRLPADGLGIQDHRLRAHLLLTRRALQAHLEQAERLKARLADGRP